MHFCRIRIYRLQYRSRHSGNWWDPNFRSAQPRLAPARRHEPHDFVIRGSQKEVQIGFVGGSSILPQVSSSANFHPWKRGHISRSIGIDTIDHIWKPSLFPINHTSISPFQHRNACDSGTRAKLPHVISGFQVEKKSAVTMTHSSFPFFSKASLARNLQTPTSPPPPSKLKRPLTQPQPLLLPSLSSCISGQGSGLVLLLL